MDKSKLPARVGFLDHTAKLSGGEIALHRLLSVVDRAKISLLVILAEDGPLREAFERSGVSVMVVPLSQEVANVKKDSVDTGILARLRLIPLTLSYSVKLSGILKQSEIQIVHTNSLKAAFYGIVAARLAGAKLVWHIRDNIETPYLPDPAVKVVRLLAAIFPDYVVANSKSTLASLHLPHRKPSKVISSGITTDPKDFPQRATFRSNTIVTVILVGRIARWKGQHVLLEAATLLRQMGFNLKYLIAGESMFGETSYFEELQQYVKENDLQDQVEFLGFVGDVKSKLKASDIFVHTSITPEPFGQVVVEAMAAGIPVIASNEGGPAEIVTDHVNGLLVKPGDPARLARAISELVNDAELSFQLACAAFDHVTKNYSIKASADSLETVYAEILNFNSLIDPMVVGG